MKPYRPRDPKRAQLLARLYHAHKTYKEIAAEYGGTAHGVRSNVRRLKERGAL